MNKNSLKSLKNFFNQFKAIVYKKHEIVLRADDNPTGVFYLTKGYVKCYSISKDGEELILFILHPGNIFPLSWAINGGDNKYYYETLCQAQILRCPRNKFLNFLISSPDVFTLLFDHILNRFDAVLNRMEQLVFGDAYAKVVTLLLLYADRFGKKQDEGVIIQVPLTHKDIAALLGMTRETVSLEIEKLEEKGMVVYKGKTTFILKNIKHLRKEI